MPAVDPKKLKRLMTLELLLPFALKRKLSGGQLGDLVRRAMLDRRFDLSAHCDEFAGYMDASEASDWAAEFERSGVAPHVFDVPERAEEASTKSALPILSPEQRLAIANRIEFERAKKKN
jgi:hypothetical protein